MSVVIGKWIDEPSEYLDITEIGARAMQEDCLRACAEAELSWEETLEALQ